MRFSYSLGGGVRFRGGLKHRSERAAASAQTDTVLVPRNSTLGLVGLYILARTSGQPLVDEANP